MENGVSGVDEAIQRLRFQIPADCHARGRGGETETLEIESETRHSPTAVLPYQPELLSRLNTEPEPRRPVPKPVLSRSSTVIHGLGWTRSQRRKSSSQEDVSMLAGETLPFTYPEDRSGRPRGNRMEREASSGDSVHGAAVYSSAGAYTSAGKMDGDWSAAPRATTTVTDYSSAYPNVSAGSGYGSGASAGGVVESYGLECSLCMEEFEEEGEHVPRNLQCGHTYCTGQRTGVVHVAVARSTFLNCKTDNFRARG